MNPLKVEAAPQIPKVPQLHLPLTWEGMGSAPSGTPVPILGQRTCLTPPNKSSDGQNNAKPPSHEGLMVTLPIFHGCRGQAGAVPGRKPSVPAGSRGGVSLPDHNTASSFPFPFSVLLAKQHNVYTSGYYICQNNYAMTNGTSM